MNRDFEDMLAALEASGARYLVVGAHALAVHGIPRATGDLDLWVEASPENADRVWTAILAFGAPAEALGVELADLARSGTVVQIGMAPRRIDILTGIDGVSFEEAWPGRTSARLGKIEVPVIGRDAIVRNKRATGRAKDLADLEALGEST